MSIENTFRGLRSRLLQAHEYANLSMAPTEIYAVLDEHDRLYQLVNNAQTDDFLEAVKLEAAHQVEKWGEAHDRGKSAENWFWLVGYLAGKALRAAITGDREKALHHTISSAAALLNWHKAINADKTGAGIGDDRDLVELNRFRASFAAPDAREAHKPTAAGAES